MVGDLPYICARDVFPGKNELSSIVTIDLQIFMAPLCGTSCAYCQKTLSPGYGNFFPDLGYRFAVCDSMENNFFKLKVPIRIYLFSVISMENSRFGFRNPL